MLSLPDLPSPRALLAAIVESSDDAIVSKDLNGIITSWNRGAERIFGFSADEAVGRSIVLIIPAERLNEETYILDKIRKGERIDHFETVRQRKDGVQINVSVTISPVRDDIGTIVGASKVARDISSAKNEAARLAAHSAKLAVLHRVGAALTGELDLENLVQLVTDAGRELSGAAFGAFFYNVVNEQGEAYMLYTLSGAPREAFEKFGMPRNTPVFGPTFSGEGVVRVGDILKDPRYGKMAPHHGMPEGHLPVRSYLAVPVFSRSGEVIGGLFFGHPEPNIFAAESEEALLAIAGQAGVAIDNARLYAAVEKELSQQKVLEKALRESEALSTGILNSTPDSIAVLESDGRVVMLNASGLQLLGITDFQQAAGVQFADLWPIEMRAGLKVAVSEALGKASGRFQGKILVPGGGTQWWDILISSSRKIPGANEVRLIVTARDVSDLRRAEEEARAAAEEALKQGRIKDEFLATLSHELRRPLQSILGWTDILKEPDCTAEELKEGLDVIARNTYAQSRIVEDLLDMNRILSGKVRLDVQQVSLADVIEDTIETVRPAANAKELRLQVILDSLARPVSGDPSRLQQVFWNLLTNAIKFTPRGGAIQVTLERVNSHLEVNVSDSGEGINAEFLPYVFDRFRQADGSITRSHGGLGLGLAIVKHLTELHGGSVRAKSPGSGKGSTFTVLLPLAPVTESAPAPRFEMSSDAEAEEESAPDLGGIRVVVVDDEADSRALLARILKRAGCEVEEAASAEQALNKVGAFRPHVLISDIGMPGQDGYALIKAVRQLPVADGGRIPAVALTAYTRTGDRIRAISAGFNIHLSKPTNARELLTVVRSLGREGRDS